MIEAGPLSCGDVEARALLDKYIARRITDEERTAFELHYFDCQKCQGELRLRVAARAALRDHTIARRVPAWLPAGGLAAAALIGVLLVRSGPAAELRNLGGVANAPAYRGRPVRAAGQTTDAAFLRAMQAYQRGDYERAAAGLNTTLAMDSTFAPAAFFLGASLLSLDLPEAALAGFSRAVAAGPSPYLAESYYYRAKSALRLGRGTQALADLEVASKLGAPISAAAAALADSVRQRLPR